MKYRNAPFVFLFFVLLIVTLIFAAAGRALRDETSSTPAPWPPPQLTPDPIQPTRTPGWWGAVPAPVPFPTPTPRN